MKLEVIIIDDDEIVILIQKKMIMNSSFYDKPLAFRNGKLGLDYILSNKEKDTIYFILLDINMPVMNGWEFLDAINQSAVANQVLIAVVTSSANDLDRQKAYQYPQVLRYLEKPINTQKLRELKQLKELESFFVNNDE